MSLCLSFAATPKRTYIDAAAMHKWLVHRNLPLAAMQIPHLQRPVQCKLPPTAMQIQDSQMVERAARWFYVKRSTIAGHIDSSKGWAYTAPLGKLTHAQPSEAVSFQNAVALLSLICKRLEQVQIHAWDFGRIIEKYQSPHTLFYIDSPY